MFFLELFGREATEEPFSFLLVSANPRGSFECRNQYLFLFSPYQKLILFSFVACYTFQVFVVEKSVLTFVSLEILEAHFLRNMSSTDHAQNVGFMLQ